MSSSGQRAAISTVHEHAAIVGAYAVLSMAISWPLAGELATNLIGNGLDALSDFWGVWHAVQAITGPEPLFHTDLLYYPAGASLLLHSAGPLSGVLALPFWPLGPIAGYNGALLGGLTLTGYGMYLLARDLGCSRGASLFAGVVLLSAPIHLVGLRGHLAKVFLGLLPLACLALRRALDESRPRMWAAGFAGTVLLLLLHSPLQFIQIALAVPLLVLDALSRTADRKAVIRRAFVATAAAALAAAPLVIATARAAADPAMSIDRSAESAGHQPDLVQFVLPPSFSALSGEAVTKALAHWNVVPEIETEVSIPFVALLLMAAAAARTPRIGALWLVLGLGAIVISLGPSAQAFGRTWSGGWPLGLPYSWLTMLPGLEFLRTPPRFMQVGFVGIAAAAAIGVSRLSRTPASGRALASVATMLVLLEIWPAAWPVIAIAPTPDFYRRLAADRERFGVLDLPVRPMQEYSPQDFSARYQAYQLVHRKGIFGGYLSRVYERHPVSPCVFSLERAPRDVRVDGRPSPCEPAAIHQLAAAGYRYVVWHQPSEATLENLPGSWAAEDAASFVRAAFGGAPPSVQEPLVRVWALPAADHSLPAEPVVELGSGWYAPEPEWRWASSPAEIAITASRSEEVELTLAMRLIHDRNSGRGLGDSGVLIVTSGRDSVSRPIARGEQVRIPLKLSPGRQVVSLSLGAGNFRPTEFHESDPRPLSFAIEWLELTTKQEKGSGVISRGHPTPGTSAARSQ